jgi:hypothetical protein
MTTHDLPSWTDFALAQAGAAAVLTGLVFVAVTSNITRILSHRELPGRAGETVVVYAGVLCQSMILLIPGQTVRETGAEMFTLAAATLVILLAIFLPTLGRPSRQPWSWRLTRLLFILASTVPSLLAGTGLLGWTGGDLRWYAFGTIAGLIAATANAWVLLVEVIRDERYTPAGGRPALAATPRPPATGLSVRSALLAATDRAGARVSRRLRRWIRDAGAR